MTRAPRDTPQAGPASTEAVSNIRDPFREALRRIDWMLADASQEQCRAWREQALDYFREVVASPCPELSIENECDYREWIMAREILELEKESRGSRET